MEYVFFGGKTEVPGNQADEMPKNFIFPKATPNAMTNAYRITVWATEASLNNRF